MKRAIEKNEVMRRMNEQEKKEITEMTEAAKYLVLHDPQGFVIAKSNMDILKARADLEKQGAEIAR